MGIFSAFFGAFLADEGVMRVVVAITKASISVALVSMCIVLLIKAIPFLIVLALTVFVVRAFYGFDYIDRRW